MRRPNGSWGRQAAVALALCCVTPLLTAQPNTMVLDPSIIRALPPGGAAWLAQMEFDDAEPLRVIVEVPDDRTDLAPGGTQQVIVRAFALPGFQWDTLHFYSAGSVRIAGEITDADDPNTVLVATPSAAELAPGFVPELGDVQALALDLSGQPPAVARSYQIELTVEQQGLGYLFVYLSGRLHVNEEDAPDAGPLLTNSDVLFVFNQGEKAFFRESDGELPPDSNPANFDVPLPEDDSEAADANYLSMAAECFAADPADAVGFDAADGLALFEDYDDNEHALIRARLRLFDPATMSQIGDDFQTDDQGHFNLPALPEPAPPDLVLAMYAVNGQARVTKNEEQDPPVQCLRFLLDDLEARDSAGGIKLVAGLVGYEPDPHAAFSVFSALTDIAGRAATVTGLALPRVEARFPVDGDLSQFERPSMLMLVGSTDRHDWDNVQHEYGHFVQQVIFNSGKPPIADSPGGIHQFDEDLCLTKGKDEGMRQAWGEGWANFFALSLQNHPPVSVAAGAGDSRYLDRKPPNDGPDIDFDLAEIDPAHTVSWHGEGNEVAIQRVLWDLFDGSSGWQNTLSLEERSQEIWSVLAGGADSFSAFYARFRAADSSDPVAAKLFGPSLTQHRIASKPLDPASYTVGDPPGTFTWQPNLRCSTLVAEFGLHLERASPPAATQLMPPFPGDGNNNDPDAASPPAAAIGALFDQPGPVDWRVIARDPTPPATGPYFGAALAAEPSVPPCVECPAWYWLLVAAAFLLGLALLFSNNPILRALGIILIVLAILAAIWLAMNCC